MLKSGKDYKRHSALNNVLSNDNYDISEAYIFSEGNVELNQKRIYMPIYMIMFLEDTPLQNTIYKLNLIGLNQTILTQAMINQTTFISNQNV